MVEGERFYIAIVEGFIKPFPKRQQTRIKNGTYDGKEQDQEIGIFEFRSKISGGLQCFILFEMQYFPRRRGVPLG